MPLRRAQTWGLHAKLNKFGTLLQLTREWKTAETWFLCCGHAWYKHPRMGSLDSLQVPWHPNIKFTFSTTIHHKKTFTGLYTKWDSFTPRKYKVNLIRTLTYRCLRICSKPTLLQFALSDLKNSLLQNGYPRGVILTTMLMIYSTNIRTSLHYLLSQFLRKM